jgi:agmatinase
MATFKLLLLACIQTALGREIVFPPVAAIQRPLGVDDIHTDLDITQAFSGIQTFANVPYVHCLASDDESVETYDIAILGAPFDTVCTPYTGVHWPCL